MRRPDRSPRLATLCVQGQPAASTKDNADRAIVLTELTRILSEQRDWHPLDAILLPGGFFRLARAVGASSFARRHELIRKERITDAIGTALAKLDSLSPGLRLVMGVRATPRDPSESVEQVCLAFDRTGLIGAARKMFPTRREGGRRKFMSPYVEDYRSAERFITLPNGSTALLNACYDLFGVADVGTETATRRHAICRIIHSRGRTKAGDEGFRAIRDVALSDWAQLLADRQPDVLLAAIHFFQSPGRDGYWQRHGIATASASANGALALGAAHFDDSLPDSGSTLAACRVPRSHLQDGVERQARSLAPLRTLTFGAPNGIRAVLRLFTPPPKKSVGRGA